MTRGRPPKKACKEACNSAAQRGVVLEAAGIEESRIDFIHFVRQRVLFVRVKRSHSRINTPEELKVLFSSEIAGLRKVPLTTIVSRELWIFLPWGSWQYFLIGDDTITEIRNDNGKVTGTKKDSAMVQDQWDPVPALAGAPAAISPGPGFLCPYVTQSQG
jgi:hypothetical protein